MDSCQDYLLVDSDDSPNLLYDAHYTNCVTVRLFFSSDEPLTTIILCYVPTGPTLLTSIPSSIEMVVEEVSLYLERGVNSLERK